MKRKLRCDVCDDQAACGKFPSDQRACSLATVMPRDLHLEMGSSRSWRPAGQVLRAADLWVERRDTGLTVVERKTGRELDIIALADRIAQLVAARRWARDLRLPRYIVYKIPEETRPIYADFTSPILVELMASMARKASALVITEMLPSVDESWPCELRLVTVNPVAWQPPG